MAPESRLVRKTQRTSQVSTVLSISLVLFMLGLLGLLLVHAQRIANYVKENIQVTVVMEPGADSTEIQQLLRRVKGNPAVKSTAYITSDQAAEQLKSDLGEDFVEFLGYNPLGASIDIYIKAEFADTASVNSLISNLKSAKYVGDVHYQPSLIQDINTNLRTITLVLLGFSALLFIISIALINNTIRLSLYARRLLIKSMLLVGATKAFIRKPFLSRSIFNGIAGGIVAVILLAVVMYVAINQLPEFAIVEDYMALAAIGALLIILGMLLSLFCTLFAVNKYLRLRSEDLF